MNNESLSSSSSSMTAPLLSNIDVNNDPKHAHIPDSNTTELTPIPSHASPIPQRPYTSKTRFLALSQLALLNILVSWSWLTFAPISSTASTYFSVGVSAVNWLSTAFLFAFVVAAPVCLWVLNRYGPGGAIRVASVLMVVGSWVRYVGARVGGTEGFKIVMVGQVVIGLSQVFVLAAPVRFSEVWFDEGSRIGATAVASLANPLGGALGQLITPFWTPTPSSIPSMVLYISLISTICTLPTLFLPSSPPTPPRTVTTTTTNAPPTNHPPLTRDTFRLLLTNPSFPLLALPFAIYTSAFNATSSLLVPILTPFRPFTETTAGIAGGLLILLGLLSAAITSPLLDKHASWRLATIKLLVPVIALAYILLCFLPQTGSVVGVYILLSVLGAASFSLVPLALEMLVDVCGEGVGAEVSSTVCWTLGQFGGAVFILVMDALKTKGKGGDGDEDEKGQGDMRWACVFQAVVCVVVVPLPLCLGFWGTGGMVGRRNKAVADGSTNDLE